MGALTDERIVVTGASRGLGRSMALRFASDGARVALVSRSEDQLASVADEADGETLVVPADVRDPDAVDGAVEATVEAFGGVDTLVNNAGVGLLSLGDDGKRIADVTPEEWDLVLETNLTGAFLCSRAVLQRMQETDRGNVINVSSGLGRRGAPKFGPYVASKFGLEGLTQSMALEYEDDGINVNAVDPGGRVDTAFWDHLPEEQRREIRQPDVMDDAAVLLAAQGPDGVTGESMPADEWEDTLG